MKTVPESRVRNIASCILTDLMITEPKDIDVPAISYDRKVLVEVGSLQGAQGRLLIRGNWGKVRISDSMKEEGRQRFVMAHELGHFEIHKEAVRIFSCKEDYFQLWREQNPIVEKEANLFASELLMPRYMFVPLCQQKSPDLYTVKSLAEYFNTSLTATALRFLDVTPEPCAISMSQEGVIHWVKATRNFGQRITIGQRLNQNTVAYDFFVGAKIPDAPQEVLAEAWLTGGPFRQCAVIQEHSLAMPNYGSVLTMLWIKNDIDVEEDNYDEYFTPDGKRYRW